MNVNEAMSLDKGWSVTLLLLEKHDAFVIMRSAMGGFIHAGRSDTIRSYQLLLETTYPVQETWQVSPFRHRTGDSNRS